jgi:hypothetical protein
MTQLSGYVLARPGGEKVERINLEGTVRRQSNELDRQEKSDEFKLVFLKDAPRYLKWEYYDFHSSIPLPLDNIQAEPQFNSKVLICRSLSRFILLAERRKIADFVIEKFLSKSAFPNFRKVPIFVDDFVADCSSKSSTYAVTSVHGKFKGPGKALKTIILYGEEVTDSTLFRQQHDLFNFYSIGVRVRERDMTRHHSFNDGEIARIGNDGMVSTNLGETDHRSDEVLRVIKHIFKQGWIEEWARMDVNE